MSNEFFFTFNDFLIRMTQNALLFMEPHNKVYQLGTSKVFALNSV